MVAARRHAVPRPATASAGAPDAGFTLVEILVSIGLITVVMTTLTTFFVNMTSAMGNQRTRQAGIQIAIDAIERVRAIKGSALDDGRIQGNTTSAVFGVSAYLAGTQQWNLPSSGGPAATLPTTATPGPLINGVQYHQHWYVGRCWQTFSYSGQLSCGGTKNATDDIEFLRVVVAVTWPASTCATSGCSYVTSTMVHDVVEEPLFNSNEAAQAGAETVPFVPEPPKLAAMSNQSTNVNATVDLDLSGLRTGGTAPFTWSVTAPGEWGATGLPPGLAIGANTGRITGRPTTAGSAKTVTVTITDARGDTASVSFKWTISQGQDSGG